MAKKSPVEKTDAVNQPTQSSKIQKVWKGQEQFEHQLFKLLPENCIKNKSFTPFHPNTYEREHSHVFHSVDRKGQPQIYSSPSAGHFHEIEMEWDKDELVSVKCGPPVRFKYRMQRNKEMRKVKEHVVYKGADENGEQDIVDEHTHEVKYLRSEMCKLQPQHDHTSTGDYMARKYASASAAEALRQAQAITKG